MLTSTVCCKHPAATTNWPGFHSQHITNLVETLNAQLPDRYIAIGEQLLQTRSLEDSGVIEVHRPVPDVTVFQRGQGTASAGAAMTVAPTWQANIADVLEPVKQPQAAMIRELLPQGKLGRIVTRIELLSPANHYETYAVKRVEAIETGVPLIEIDYLHETPSLVHHLPIYPADREAYPYCLVVSDPRPNWNEGKVSIYGFGVGEPIKALPVPLAGEESLLLDLQAVYKHTFQAGRWGDLLDYRLEPERFKSYRRDDQKFIRAIMAKVSR
jgi:uncharacterized protein DUF4058